MSFGFGIVGLGLISHFQAKAIKADGKGKLAACCSRSPEKAEQFAREYDCTAYTSMKEFLAHPGLDIVSICTPSGNHLEPALEAAEAGKHLIIEKPLEISLPRCDRIIDSCARRGLKLAGVFQSRFYNASRLLKGALEQGRFGRLVLGDAYIKWYRSQEYYNKGGWHGTWKMDGGGALINQSIHAIDLLQWYLGPVAGVQAYSGTLGHERVEVEDTAVAAVQFRNGAMGVIEGTTAIWPGFQKRLEIHGTKGSVVMEEEHLQTWSFTEERAEDASIREHHLAAPAAGGAADPGAISFEGHRRQFLDFIDALEKNREPMVNGPEARKAVEIILAIYRSARKGKPVKLPL